MKVGLRTPHLALLSLSPQDLSGGRALSEEKTQGVLLQTHVPDRSSCLPSLLPRVDKHQHLQTRALALILTPHTSEVVYSISFWFYQCL